MVIGWWMLCDSTVIKIVILQWWPSRPNTSASSPSTHRPVWSSNASLLSCQWPSSQTPSANSGICGDLTIRMLPRCTSSSSSGGSVTTIPYSLRGLLCLLHHQLLLRLDELGKVHWPGDERSHQVLPPPQLEQRIRHPVHPATGSLSLVAIMGRRSKQITGLFSQVERGSEVAMEDPVEFRGIEKYVYWTLKCYIWVRRGIFSYG